MSTEKIETLILLLVVAFLVKFIGSQATMYYFEHAVDPLAGDALNTHQFLSAVKYQQFAGELLSVLVNLVIGYWLYINSASRRVLWAALGVCAKWWALPIFAYYLFINQSNENT